MSGISKKEIKDGLLRLGLRPGMTVMVHSSLSSLGSVQGGADAVIDALLEALGSGGTLMMPSFGSSGSVFDFRKSSTSLGKIPDVFWRRQGVKRSLHPTHSAAASGIKADKLLSGHEEAATAYGENTPYKKLIDEGGFVLMMGVDLDRMTLLHTVEAFSDAAYLQTVEKKYLDANGNIRSLTVEKMAGPHRNFIGLDKAFRENEIMKMGKIGLSVCRLVDAAGAFEYCMEKMKLKPDLMLCDNPSCFDCKMQRGRLWEEFFSFEDFTVSVSIGGIEEEVEALLPLVKNQGINEVEVALDENSDPGKLSDLLPAYGMSICAVNAGTVEKSIITGKSGFVDDLFSKALNLRADTVILKLSRAGAENARPLVEGLSRAGETAGEKGLLLLLENGFGDSSGLNEVSDIIVNAQIKNLGLAYNPANFAFEGGRPFLDRAGKLKHVSALYVADGIKNLPGAYVPPGGGNAEIAEIISSLRARSFSGKLILKSSPMSREVFRGDLSGFQKLMESL